MAMRPDFTTIQIHKRNQQALAKLSKEATKKRTHHVSMDEVLYNLIKQSRPDVLPEEEQGEVAV